MTRITTDIDEVYREYQPRIARYVSMRIANRADAEDAVSAVFLKVVAHLAEFDESKGSLSTWIYAIARNQVIDYYRKPRAVAWPEGYEPVAQALPADADAALASLAVALERLPERQRSAVVLFYYAGLSHKEIAERMGVSYINARKLCSLGVAALRAELAE